MDTYLHIRVLFSMILGLGVSHLLRGVARIMQHPKKYQVYWVHLVWSLFLFLYLLHFWWWEFRLQKIDPWTFPLYFLIAMYAMLLYLLCTLFFPDEMDDYEGFREYFYSRRRWIFGFLCLLFVVDVADTLIKGVPYLRALGPVYYVRTVLYLVLSLIAMKTDSRRFHAAFAVFATADEIGYIWTSFYTLG